MRPMTREEWKIDVIAIWKNANNGMQLHLRRDGTSYWKWKDKTTGVWDVTETTLAPATIELIDKWNVDNKKKFVRVVKVKDE